jgi:PAS domain S-box-containing protein
MSTAGFLVWLHDPRLAPLALSPLPAWLWSLDAAHVIWANPTGAAIFGAGTPSALARRHFDAGQPAAAQILKLAASLPVDGTSRLEKLRGFGAGVGRALTCNCARVTLANGTDAILIAAAERAGPDLPLPERVKRLLTDTDAPVAAFAADGTLIAAVPAAQARLDGARTLAALGADALVAEARAGGRAVGHSAAGALAIDRIGSEPVLLATFGEYGELAAPAPVVPPVSTAPPPAADAPVEMPVPPESAASELAEWRHPLRFVWQIDAENRFTLDCEEFIALAGAATKAALGRTWDELSAALALDPERQVGRALATHDTWSGLTVAWPVDDGGAPLTVELSGLPVFDRERSFRGYRGFGVCRDVARLNALAERCAGAAPAIAVQPASPPPSEPTAEAPADDHQRTPSPEADGLTPVERHAFQELARRLTGRLTAAGQSDDDAALAQSALAELAKAVAERAAEDEAQPDLFADDQVPLTTAREIGPILDRFPIGVLIYRLNHLVYANRAFLRWSGYENLTSLAEAGGLDALLIESGAFEPGGDKPFAITGNRGASTPAEGRLFMVPWEGESAFALIAAPTPPAAPAPFAPTAVAAAVAAPESVGEPAHAAELAELHAILDTATDGVIVLDRALRIAAANRSAQALFGQNADALVGQLFFDLFAPESVEAAVDYVEALLESGGVLNAGREVIGRERQGGLIPLFMTVGRLGEDTGNEGMGKLCAVFRDLTPWKKATEELIEAKRQAEKQSSAKSEFLAKVSHEVRNPLNAIIGFSEVMIEERFGPIGNDRYRQYLRDIHVSGGHIMSLVNDLLDLSKIEAGKLELTFTGVALNELVQQSVALMQPQANRERIIIRTSLAPRLPQVTADARSLRQIVLNLLSNSIKFTGAGGQVIVSTARADTGDVVLRVRDTGIGMSEKELATALEPFRQIATATRAGAIGTGLGLPLTKALAEANRAGFRINSKPNEGTLVEVAFPTERVMAD